MVLSTGDIAFVAAGAFSGFQQVTHRRNTRDSIGFARGAVDGGFDVDAIAVDFTAEDVENVANFQAYGFLPELIARFTRIVPFSALDRDTLKQILHANVVQRIVAEFASEGFELIVTEEVLDHVVSSALRRETGARGLASTLTRHLEEVAFEAFGTADGGTVRVCMIDGDIGVDLQQ